MRRELACAVCLSQGRPFAAIAGFTLLRCPDPQCAHVWVSDPPSASDLARFYDTAESRFENAGAFRLLTDYRQNPEAVREYYQRDRMRHVNARFPDLVSPGKGAVLDVGCSTGTFAATLRDHGWHVCGQDMNVQAVRAGCAELGLDLRGTSLSASDFGTTFDLVTCYDVIEHCSDVMSVLADIKSHLSPGGRLVIRTPNHSGWLLGATGRRWLWYIPAHLHYFNPRSLSSALVKAGFAVEAIRTDASTYLYLIRHYLFPARTGRSQSLDMPRWRRRAVFGLDDVVRLAALVPLYWASRSHRNPVLEIYARVVN